MVQMWCFLWSSTESTLVLVLKHLNLTKKNYCYNKIKYAEFDHEIYP